VRVVYEGDPLDKPQAWLRTIIGAYNFNPIEFFQAKAKERRQILLSAMPVSLDPELIDCGVIDKDKFDYNKHGLDVLKDIQKEVYDRRHEIGISRDQLKKSIKQDKAEMPENINQKDFENFSLNQKIEEKTEAEKLLTQHENDERQISILRDQAENAHREIEDHEQRIKGIEKSLGIIREKGKTLAAKIESFSAENTTQHISNLQSEINNYQQFQKLALRLEDIGRREDDLDQIAHKHQMLDSFYKKLTTEIPRKLLSQIDLPIDNLRIDDDTIFVNDVDIDKLSDSEKLRFAIKFARQIAGKLKVICADRFESLDEDNRKTFERESENDGFEYFMTIVTGGELSHEAIDPESKQRDEAITET